MSSVGSGLRHAAEPQKRRRFRVLPLALWALTSVFVGIVFLAATNRAVNWSSSDRFCGQFCHSMTWVNAAYKRSPHYQNAVGVSASCGDCHIPYDASHTTAMEYIYLLGFKADRGAKDFYNEATKTIATKEEWEKRRPHLASEFEGFLARHNYVTCRGCHQLQSFGGPHSEMKQMIHQKFATPDNYNCLHCHSDIGHVYDETSTSAKSAAEAADVHSIGWYTAEQADAGSQLFAQSCSSCHGTQLEGGAGPALVGGSWKQLFAGAKLLMIWGEIHGPMAQYAGKSFTEQQSLDILAFLLKQNGLPPGLKPLADTGELNRRLAK